MVRFESPRWFLEAMQDSDERKAARQQGDPRVRRAVIERLTELGYDARRMTLLSFTPRTALVSEVRDGGYAADVIVDLASGERIVVDEIDGEGE